MASTKVEERWQAKRSTILERNKYMFNNPLMSDVKFAFPNTVADTTIPAHKYVLAVSSPVFFAMFYGDLAETRNTIDITDCDPDIFLRFLRFLYCDETNFRDADCAIKVWYLADKYDVPSLARESVKYLDGNMDPLGVFYVLMYARQFNDQSLETACWEVIDYNAEAIVRDDSFLNIKHELLVSFLQRSSLRIEVEATLFKAVDRWAAKRCEEAGMTVDGANKRDALGDDLLKNIRFPLMSPTTFSDVVLPKEILTKDEVIDVFKSFSKVPIRGGLKFSVLPRVTSTDTSGYFCSLSSVNKMISQSFIENKKLTFSVSRRVLLCGLEFLFGRNDSRCCLRLSVWRTGEKVKDISATSRKYYGCSIGFPSSHRDQGTRVFFNRPICVEAQTCYTIELKEASSRSQDVCVSPDSKSQNNSMFRYCAGCYSDEISQKRPYSGFISSLIFTTCSSRDSHGKKKFEV